MQFEKGQSGNPAGRPRGSRNKHTIAAEKLFAEDAEVLARVAIDLAKAGGLPVNPLLIPCIIRPDACSEPPNACSFDDASPDNHAKVVNLQGWRACSARRSKPN